MFGNKGDQYGRVDSVIGAEAEIKGHITSKSTIRVDGKVEGDVRCEGDIIIGKEGKIRGDLEAKSIIIGGKVLGNIVSGVKVEILEGGQIVGDIKSPAVVIAEGGMFEGHCEMSKEKSKILELSEKESKANVRSRANE